MFVAVLKALRVTAKRAQVSHKCKGFDNISIVFWSLKSFLFPNFQPLYLSVRHLAARTPLAKKKVNFLFVFVMSVSKVTDTNALVSAMSTILPFTFLQP